MLSTKHYRLLMPDSSPGKPPRLFATGCLFLKRYNLLHDESDFDRGISAHREAIRLTPEGHPAKPGVLNNLGISLLSHFERLGDEQDINASISAHEDAVRLAPDGHRDRPVTLTNLGISLLRRFERFDDIHDIDRSVSSLEDAVRLAPDHHPKKPSMLNSLGVALQRRFGRQRHMADLIRSISVHEDAVRIPAGHPSRPDFLNSLGTSLSRHFECHGDAAEIRRSISVLEEAVRLLPDTHPSKPIVLSSLGTALIIRFDRFEDVSDIKNSISAHDNAVQLTPEGHPDIPARLNSLGNSLSRRFEHLGVVADIDRAISTHERAVRLIPDGHAAKRGYLDNLGIALRLRFKRLRDVADIDQSTTVHRDAVQLTPDGHPDKPGFLVNLGNTLMRRFDYRGEVDDINNSLSALENAVSSISDDHPKKVHFLTNLGIALLGRFETLKDAADINKSVLVLEEVVRLTPDTYPHKPARLTNLGRSLLCRFEHLKDAADVTRAISTLEYAVSTAPDTHPNKPATLSILGRSFLGRFDRLKTKEDLDAAILSSSSAARSPTGPPSDRFDAALLWAKCCLKIGPSSSLEAYRCALDLLPRVAWLGLPIVERHRELAVIGEVVRDAAAAAIESQEYGTALEWLEQGRSVVWGQLLHLRTPVDALRTQKASLADRLERISRDLERVSTRDTFLESSNQRSREEVSQLHRELATDYESVIEEIRALPEFKDFLKPKRLAQFRSAARSGPVVVINMHSSRCDALLLIPGFDEVVHLPLDTFSYNRADELHQSLGGLVSGRGPRVRSGRDPVRDDVPSDDDQFIEILSELWVHIVKPVLESLAFPLPQATDPPRIWWCPTGPLTFLPLHAAGIYDTTERGHKVSDFVVSSYTPTLTALVDTPRATSKNEFQLLAIAQPFTPGQTSLPGTTRELVHIRNHAGRFSVLSLEAAEATVERVVESMPNCDWIHLACHGAQDTNVPAKSAFFLQGGQLELLRIVQLHLSHAEFAFLSACKTATGDKRLSEEAVNLAVGMLLAGYRSVIATTWSIKDYDAPQVADEVYSRLFKGHKPDHTQAALALHQAVQRLRESKGVSFISWVPFIHVGM